MLRAEFEKIWSRPFIRIAFLLVCFSQVLYTFMNYNPNLKEVEDAYENISFTEMLDEYTNRLKEVYGDYGVEAYANLREASEQGELVFGISPAGNIMTNQNGIALAVMVFMMILCVDLFSGEKEMGMVPMQKVTRYGRKKLFQTKLLVCQISACVVWVAANLSFAITLTTVYGWGNVRSVVQDFQFNACPYNWNAGEFLIVVLICGFLASQITALMIFLLTYYTNNTQKAFAVMGGTMLLPYLLAFFLNNIKLAMWIPCLMNNSWLWKGLHLIRFQKTYIPMWSIAIIECILIGIISFLILHCMIKKQTE